MRFTPVEPPREFQVGHASSVTLKDCARICLEPDEQVTFVTESGAEYDVTRKRWGFYATPSLNGRLRQFGWQSALVKSPAGRLYVFLVEGKREEEFRQYLESENHTVVCWLHREEDLALLERSLESRPR